MARTKFLGLTSHAPKHRMAVLQAWARRSEQTGQIETGSCLFDVVGLVTIIQEHKGERFVVTEAQICVDGEVVVLSVAHEEFFPPCSMSEVVVCSWPRDKDKKHLGWQMKALEKMAESELEDRDGERQAGQDFQKDQEANLPPPAAQAPAIKKKALPFLRNLDGGAMPFSAN